MKRLSVIVPMLNEAEGIVTTLQPLQRLRTLGHEVIVVDGGSSDGSPALAAPLADRVEVAAAGRGPQMNAGAAVASGDVLLFLHADTQLPERVEQLIAQALAGRRVWGRFDVRLSGRQPLLRLVERLMNLRSCLTGIATGDQAMFMTRLAFEQAGQFPEIPLMEDIALSRALKQLSRPACVHVPVLTSSRRWEQRGILRTILLMWRLRLAYFLGVDPALLALRYR
jgi:rSAM/selenodomain-associated transferase 2